MKRKEKEEGGMRNDDDRGGKRRKEEEGKGDQSVERDSTKSTQFLNPSALSLSLFVSLSSSLFSPVRWAVTPAKPP